MIQAINNFFLSGFKNASYFEKRKATYLFYIIMTALTFVVFITLGQGSIQMGFIYMTANLFALIGISSSLVFFKLKRINAAGHVMACSLLITIIVETIVRDLFSFDPAIRYRIYINLSTLLGVCFIILSFFRDKKYVFIYGIVFELILWGHAAVIYQQIKDQPKKGHVRVTARYDRIYRHGHHARDLYLAAIVHGGVVSTKHGVCRAIQIAKRTVGKNG